MTTIEKSAWIHIQDRKVLLVRSVHNDTFYTPGGKREVGETSEMALVREIMEELSVSLIPETIKMVFEATAPAHGKGEGIDVHLICFTADYRGDLASSAEIAEMRWCTSTELPTLSEAGVQVILWLKEKDLID